MEGLLSTGPTPSSFLLNPPIIESVSQSFFYFNSSKHHKSQTVRAREHNVYHLSCVICDISHGGSSHVDMARRGGGDYCP